MASSGSFSGSIHSGHYVLRVDWTQTKNVSANTSTITAKAYLVNDWSLSINARSDNKVTIDGTAQTYASPAISSTGTHLLGTVTQTVNHGSDGTKSLAMSAVFYIRATLSGTYYESITASANITLDSIARASTVSASNVEMGSATTIAISRASSSFTHTLTYAFGSATGTIATKTTSTSVSWTPPLTLAGQIPKAVTGTGTITCTTYNGNTSIGSKTCTLTLTVPASVKPTITSLTAARVDGAVPSTWGIYVQTKSKATLTINGAAGSYGSTISSYSITGGGYTSTASSFTTGFLNTSGTVTFTATDYDLSVVEQRMLNPEFAELVKVGKTYYNGQANENSDIAVMENRAGTLALKAMQIINELKRNWTEDSIDYWKALRELCLMRPTLSRKNVEQNSQYQLVYMCAPGEITAYSYEQEGDYNKNINIKFDGSLPRKMSEDEVHLKEIMQIPGVKALFEKHGYATSFVPSEFILTPPMFNNIYKGALGEVVGKYILEQYAGVTLQEMPPEFFELFDYTLGNGVYVDFKLWKETMLISAEEEKKNVLEKLDKCGGKRAVIINIMLDHNMQITSSDNGRIIEIPYLYRLDRKEIGTEIIAKINREGYLQ